MLYITHSNGWNSHLHWKQLKYMVGFPGKIHPQLLWTCLLLKYFSSIDYCYRNHSLNFNKDIFPARKVQYDTRPPRLVVVSLWKVAVTLLNLWQTSFWLDYSLWSLDLGWNHSFMAKSFLVFYILLWPGRFTCRVSDDGLRCWWLESCDRSAHFSGPALV